MNVSIKKFFVQEWWDDRVRLGSQLVYPSNDDFTRGGQGDGTWFRTVAISSLYDDFHRYFVSHPKRHRLEGDIGCSGFMMIFRGMLPEGLETTYARTPRGRARCIRFHDVERYRSRIAA